MAERWVGRFAPTPSGPLHFGSLVAALGSYLIARQKQGKWLVRIEDIDSPREVPGATKEILDTLNCFGFQWDGEVVYQSQRHSLYQDALDYLYSKSLLYQCDCSRKMIFERNKGVYDQYCRNRNLSRETESAVRIKFEPQDLFFHDQVFGKRLLNQPKDLQDYVVRRRDGLFAYQLAVVVDDIEQGINHIVRGADILDSTPRQNFLYDCFNKKTPMYFHLPLAVDEMKRKLSKSKLSSAVKQSQATPLLLKAYSHLGQISDDALMQAKPSEFLQWAIKNFNPELIDTDMIAYSDDVLV